MKEKNGMFQRLSRMRNISVCAGILVFSLSVSGCGGDSDDVAQDTPSEDGVIQTQYGKVQGVDEGSIVAFKGIPFAQPPVGDLRWKPPQEPDSWDGIMTADTFGYDCMQLSSSHANTTGRSEDCLYLNVYKPASAKPGDRLPVHVWIYGGAFAGGSSSSPSYDNLLDVDAGIIYVNFNYRVNAFGFFSHPGLTAESENKASGNYGLMDQIAALKWVQENIAAFGGDPDSVTISGESAGAASIGYLIQSPLASGLFRRVIMESTFGFHPQRTLAEQEARMVEVFGEDINELRNTPAEDIVKVLSGEGIETTGGIFGFQDWVPAIDGYVLRQSDRQAWKDGNFQKVDMFIGDNENEGAFFMGIGGLQALPPESRTVDGFRAFIAEQYGDLSEKALDVYPVTDDASVLWQLAMSYGDSWFQYSAREMSRHMMKYNQNVFRYVFTKHAAEPRMIGGRPVASHTDEMPYIFGSVQVGDKYDESDLTLSEQMVRAKQNFIKTGNPNGEGFPVSWPQYDQTDPYLEFGNEGLRVGYGYRNDAYDLITEYLESKYPLD